MSRPKNTPWNNGHCHTPKAIGIRARYKREQAEKKAAEEKRNADGTPGIPA